MLYLNASIYSPNAIVCTKRKLRREEGEGGLQNRTEACSEACSLVRCWSCLALSGEKQRGRALK